TIDVLEANGELTRMGVARAEPRGAEPAQEPDPFVQAVVKSGRHLVIPALSHRQEFDEESPEAGPRVDEASLICVPVASRGQPLGALTLARTTQGSEYGADELALAEDLAARIGIAIDRARLYLEVEERADAARVLTYVADRPPRRPGRRRPALEPSCREHHRNCLGRRAGAASGGGDTRLAR